MDFCELDLMLRGLAYEVVEEPVLFNPLRIHEPHGIRGAEEVRGVGVVLLGERILGEPPGDEGIVLLGAEVVQFQALACSPLLALELQRLECRGGGVLCERSAEGIVVVVLLGRAAGVGHDPNGAQMVRDEEVVAAVRHGDIAPVKEQAGARAVLQHQIPGVVGGGRGAGDRPGLAQLRAVGGVGVADRGAVGEGHGLGQAQDIPGDGGAPATNRRQGKRIVDQSADNRTRRFVMLRELIASLKTPNVYSAIE